MIKITRKQLRKLIMEMPMGGYFGSMHGGTGEDFISAVEMEAMKYPEYSIYIDDASNNPNEFVISSSRRDDAMGPHSHYLTSIHVEVQERDGMIYIDGQPFSSYEQAAAQILSDLEDERQYSIMSESVYGSKYYKAPPRDPTHHLPHLSPRQREKIGRLTGGEDESFQRMGYDLATTLQQDELVFPEEGEPYTKKPYEGDDYLGDVNKHIRRRFMRETGGLAEYLANEDIEMLMKLRGKELGYGIFGHAGSGFQFEANGHYAGIAISPDALTNMATRVASKKKNITQRDIDAHEGMDSGVEAHHKVATMIMGLSGTTAIGQYSLTDCGVGEVIEKDLNGNYVGMIDFYDPRYEKLYKSGKLIIEFGK